MVCIAKTSSLFLTACTTSNTPPSMVGLTGDDLEIRLANAQLTLNLVGRPDLDVMHQRADRTMSARLNRMQICNHAWHIQGNQLCTIYVIGGQPVCGYVERGAAAISDDAVTLHQTTGTMGVADGLTGHIKPLLTAAIFIQINALSCS